MKGAELAREYERRYPDTGCPEAQKQERMERIAHREERDSLRRTGRNRGIIVPALPWLDEVREGVAA